MKVTVTVRLLFKFTVHSCPDTESQPAQPPNAEPFGVAVNVTAVPLAKLALHVVAQPRPAGELVMDPEPVPAKVTVRVGPAPLKQTTFAVIKPVTMAPVEDTFPMLLFVVTVADTRAFPQASPVAVSRPVELTVTRSCVFESQVTWSVMSLVTGGCI